MAIKFSSKIDAAGYFPSNPKPAQGVPGFLGFLTPSDNGSGITPDIIKLEEDTNAVIQKLMDRHKGIVENSFVGSGRQPVVGSSEGQIPLLDEGSYRQVYSQTPNASVIIKKRTFSSLKHLYNPIYMNAAEKWLYRATKRLVQRKCFIMAEYERLTKISQMIDLNYGALSILKSVADDITVEQKDLYRTLEAVIRARNPALTTTYFVDPFDPEISEIGLGQGVFEIATVTELRTNLDLDGNGDCSFSLEDPNRILFITDEDIEFSVNETKPFNFSSNDKATAALFDAQMYEASLNSSRNTNNKSTVTFEIYNNGLNTILDTTSEAIADINTVSPQQSFSDKEKELYNSTMASLQEYVYSVLEAKKAGGPDAAEIPEFLDSLNYVRSRMRLFYLGKYLIQPMDEIHIYIDGGTRNFKEAVENVGSQKDSWVSMTDAGTLQSSTPNLDDDFLEQEWNTYKKGIPGEMTQEQFNRVRKLQTEVNSGAHVFGGLVKEANDTYDANTGKFTLSITGTSNMEWLKISRYNKEPSLDQTQGLVNDPLTPMSIKTDLATGLPIGEPELSEENMQFLYEKYTFHPAGPKKGLEANNLKSLEVSKDFQGGHVITTYQHVPGLTYKWKEGVMTITYNHFLRDAKNLSLVDSRALRRDIGFFWSNSAFDNLDAANIISILVSGIPYNAATFIQSTKSAFIPNSSMDANKDFFSTFLDFQSTNVKINGNFIPYKTVSVSPEALAMATSLQIRLTGISSELQQLRAKEADISDKIFNFDSPTRSTEIDGLVSSLKAQQSAIRTKITSIQSQLKTDLDPSKIQNAIVQVAGNDVMFDMKDSDDIKTYGDKLLYMTQRRKEDVIYNLDKNLLIVSDEYDKDYDIQAFVLQMRQQSPEMFKSTWADVYNLCKTVAEILDFEFFVDTQGHIVFRPPQYNKVPISVLKSMLELYKGQGIQLISDPVLQLYATREESIINDIVTLEWEIAMKGALLGYKITVGNTNTFDVATKNNLKFIMGSVWDNKQGIIWNEAMTPENRNATLGLVHSANLATQLTTLNNGMFSALAQNDVQNSKETTKSDKESYDFAKIQVSRLKGIPLQNFEEFDKVAVGSVRNGQTTPTTDRSNIITQISELISRRSKLLRTLERIMSQVNEIGEVKNNKLQAKMLSNDNLILNDLNRRFIEDDTKNLIGYMSGKRFIIKDEHIFSSSFSEKPPAITTVTVKGAEPILGPAQEGDAIGINYIAFGADFDMWRQYGWRTDRVFEKPFFTSAELQCAPYALMLLSRQRKNVVTGSVTIIGNEFYQLGDVVYVTDRRLLYYVNGISHSFSYGGDFKTTLSLTYGHPSGEYIPTPLDIIGKMSIRQGSVGEYRMNKQLSYTNKLLGIVKYEAEDESDSFLTNKYFKQNYDSLIQAATKAKIEAVGIYPNSPRVFVTTYSNDSGDSIQSRREAIKNWLVNNVKLDVANSGQGVIAIQTPAVGGSSDSMISLDSIIEMHIQLPEKGADRSPLEIELLQRMQMVASQESYFFDPTLENVVEVRIVQMPSGGWDKWITKNIKPGSQ